MIDEIISDTEKIKYLPKKESKTLTRPDISGPGVYALHHRKSDGVYVGSSGHLYNRLNGHRQQLKAGTHKNRNLQQAFNDDPVFDATYRLTETKEKAVELEQQLLDNLSENPKLLNLATDAVNPGSGYEVTEETREKQRQNNKRQFSDKEKRERHRESCRAKWKDPEYRQKHVNKEIPQPTKEKISGTISEQWKDPNHRDKMLKAHARRRKPFIVDGQIYEGVRGAAEALGVSENTIRYRMKHPIYRDNYHFLNPEDKLTYEK